MTTVLYTGHALCADTKMALPTKPTRFARNTQKVFKSENGEFAYAFTGIVPPRTKPIVKVLETIYHDILVELCRSNVLDRGQLAIRYPKWYTLSEKERNVCFNAGVMLITHNQAFYIAMDARAEFENIGIPMEALGKKVEAVLNSPYVYPIQGIPSGQGSGGPYALGVYAVTNDLDKTFSEVALHDPLSANTYHSVMQSELLPLTVG